MPNLSLNNILISSFSADFTVTDLKYDNHPRFNSIREALNYCEYEQSKQT